MLCILKIIQNTHNAEFLKLKLVVHIVTATHERDNEYRCRRHNRRVPIKQQTNSESFVCKQVYILKVVTDKISTRYGTKNYIQYIFH